MNIEWNTVDRPTDELAVRTNMLSTSSLSSHDRRTSISRSKKILRSRHQLVRRQSHNPRHGESDTCRRTDRLSRSYSGHDRGKEMKRNESSSILIRKTQIESIHASYDNLKRRRSSSRMFSTTRDSERAGFSESNASPSMSNVSFDKVSIREYARCVGDNPGVTTAGPPLS